MSTVRTYHLLLPAFALLLQASCSNPRKEYEPLQRMQSAVDASIQSTTGDATRFKACDSVITSLQEFIDRHPDGQWNATAKSDLEKWQSTRAGILEKINRKVDFEEVQKLQDATEQVMQHTTDYAVRTKSCDIVINALDTYLARHTEGEWIAPAKTALASWQSRKDTLEQELASLSDKLYGMMKARAIQAAKNRDGRSKVEEIKLDNREKKTLGANIQVTDVYAVRMRGSLSGSSTIELKITVSGRIDPVRKKVYVDEKPIVEG